MCVHSHRRLLGARESGPTFATFSRSLLSFTFTQGITRGAHGRRIRDWCHGAGSRAPSGRVCVCVCCVCVCVVCCVCNMYLYSTYTRVQVYMICTFVICAFSIFPTSLQDDEQSAASREKATVRNASAIVSALQNRRPLTFAGMSYMVAGILPVYSRSYVLYSRSYVLCSRRYVLYSCWIAAPLCFIWLLSRRYVLHSRRYIVAGMYYSVAGMWCQPCLCLCLCLCRCLSVPIFMSVSVRIPACACVYIVYIYTAQVCLYYIYTYVLCRWGAVQSGRGIPAAVPHFIALALPVRPALTYKHMIYCIFANTMYARTRTGLKLCPVSQCQ